MWWNTPSLRPLVMLDPNGALFQHPYLPHARVWTDGWTLKQVQGDEGWGCATDRQNNEPGHFASDRVHEI